jgi:serine/threonine-protein kinase
MPPTVDRSRDLLFGLLALQTGLINQAQLVAAFHAWTQARGRAMAEILAEQGALSAPCVTLVEGLVIEHLRRHGDDPERSLAALGVARSTRECLAQIGNPELDASLAHVGSGSTEHDGDPDRTATYSVGTAASDGQRFRVLRPHAQGGLGAVFVALDAELHREVALKQILGHHADDPISRQRFLLEAEITGGLEHPGVVPVYGLGTYGDGRPYYAMRFIRGDSLKEAIDRVHADESLQKDPGRRALELRKLLRRFTDVCNAIAYAHSRGVLHRDIKPGNVIVGKYGETLVVDWGLAKAVGRADPGAVPDERTLVPSSSRSLAETLPGSALGTPAYMSPEQAEGDLEHLGPRSDVYSLGATLYCLLTGGPPFAGDPAEVIPHVQRGDFRPPRQVDPAIDRALQAVCLQAMARRPEDRYATPKALAEDVERWMADEPVTAWREPLGRRLRRWGRRHRLLVTGLAATLLVAVGALAVGNVLVARQRDRAERNLAFARLVVDEMYTGVSDKLEDQKGMDAYQRELLEKALQFYERFALPQSRDPQTRLEAARAGLRVGAIRSRLGQTAAAEHAHRQAVEALSRLVADHPAESAQRDALAQAHRELGYVLDNQERWPESERETAEAAALWRELAREQPGIPEYRRQLAETRSRLSSIYRQQFRVQEAEAASLQALDDAERMLREFPDVTAYQESLALILERHAILQSDTLRNFPAAKAAKERALPIRERLARDHPEVTKYQARLAQLLSNLRSEYVHAGDLPRAVEALRRSLAILERLAADHPLNMGIVSSLGTAYQHMADTLLVQGDYQSALEWSGRAIEVFRSLARRDPRNIYSGRGWLWRSLAERAETSMRLGRHVEAVADYEEIIELTRDIRPGELFRSFHALTRARLGDLSALARQRDEIREILKVGAGLDMKSPYIYYMLYYDAACIHTALVRLALQDQRKPPAERQRLARPDKERALELLSKARASGEFKTAIPLDEVRKETLLDPLRSDPRFQDLMMDLEFPDDPFRP